jgi:hypothetical protein
MGLPSSIEIVFLLIFIALIVIFLKRTFWAIVGGVIGLFAVKGLFFDNIELAGWEYFWDAVKHHNMNTNEIKEIVSKSTTFHKSLIGFAIGYITGLSISKKLKIK